jgi:hypothetical protein
VKPSIPKPQAVESALRLTERRLEAAVKRINREAAKAMKAGDYDAARRWMGSGKLVADFSTRAAAFAQEWRRLVKAARISAPGPDETEPPPEPGDQT